MENLEPRIYRQRLVIEGKYSLKISAYKLKKFLTLLSKELGMSIIYGPIVKNLAKNINPIHEGFECIAIWAESGVQLYTWNRYDFFTLDVYSCKSFDEEKTVEFTRSFFKSDKIVCKSV